MGLPYIERRRLAKVGVNVPQGKVTIVPVFSSRGQRSGLCLGLGLRSAAVGEFVWLGGRPHITPALDRQLCWTVYNKQNAGIAT